MKKTAYLLLGLIFTVLISSGQDKDHNNTMIISHLNEKIDACNIVYSSSFRAAWTKLKNDIVGEDIRTKEPLSIVRNLNANPYPVLEQEKFIAIGGFIKDGIIDDINNTMKMNFRNYQTNLEKHEDVEEGILCFSYFQEEIIFLQTFNTMTYVFNYEGNEIKVDCFGISNSNNLELYKQVEVFDYKNRDDFIVKIKGRNQNEEIILAKVQLDRTLGNTLEQINKRINENNPETMSRIDKLIVPKVNFSINHMYTQFKNKYLANKGFEEYYFLEARQHIQLSMNESGTYANSLADIVLEKKGSMPKELVFDKPFLLIIKNSQTNEYDIVVWIYDLEFLKTVN